MSTSLDFQNFFRLKDPLSNQALRLRSYTDWLDHQIVGSLYTGELSEPTQPLQLYGYQGGRPMDFLWTAFPPMRCVSSKVIELLKTNNFTGWSIYPVEVFDRKGQYLPDYYGFAITGKAGEQDRNRSEIIIKPPSAPQGKPHQVYKGLFFDEQSWDGSDFFVLANSYWTIVAPSVQKIFKKHRVNNVHLIPLTEVEIPVVMDKFRSEN